MHCPCVKAARTAPGNGDRLSTGTVGHGRYRCTCTGRDLDRPVPEDDMLGFDPDQLRYVDTLKSVQLDVSRRGVEMADVDSELLQRLASLGPNMEEELAALLRSNGGLYQQAMYALQQTLGNQGVNDLHMRVQ